MKPSTGTGRLLWHVLGPKTIELIHENIHVDAIRDDLETLVLDADLLEAVLGSPDPDNKAKEIEIKVARRLRNREHDPRFKELGERLEDLRQRHQQGLLLSVDFLKELLNLAHDVVAAENAAAPMVDEDLGKAAQTHLAASTRTQYKKYVDVHLIPTLGASPLNRLDVARIQKLQAALLADESARKVIAILQGILQRAVEWGYLQVNPAKAVRKLPQSRTQTIRPLAPETIEKMREK